MNYHRIRDIRAACEELGGDLHQLGDTKRRQPRRYRATVPNLTPLDGADKDGLIQWANDHLPPQQ